MENRTDALIRELTDGMYDRQMLVDALNDIARMMTILYLEHPRTAEEQKKMQLVFDELNAVIEKI